MPTLRLALAQVNPTVGDLDGNVALVTAAMRDAEADGVDLLVFPELVLTGYPPEDLLLKPRFVADAGAALTRVAAAAGDTVSVVGAVVADEGGLRNAAAVVHRGQVLAVVAKRRLPNEAVFDEERYFEPGAGPVTVVEVAGCRIGVSVCEDAWGADGPFAALGAAGVDLVVNLNASPFHAGKHRDRLAVLAERAAEAGAAVGYVNQVGGQDELVFDGGSFVIDAGGNELARAPQFVTDRCVVDLDLAGRSDSGAAGAGDATGPRVVRATESSRAVTPPRPGVLVPPLDPVREVYEALVLGTRDYVRKNGFLDVVLGLSGGVDSSLVATIAVDALGADHVHGVLLPSRFSSDHSVADALALADGLGIETRTVPIEAAHTAFDAMLAPSFELATSGLTEENLQSRIRGVVLMALSNQFGWMVLTTSNKSESAVGYSTLYGDSAGGYAVIKDVPKLLVYELCRHRNARSDRVLIPESVLTKPPSAELRPGQRDDQSLPPYEELDPILAGYVEGDLTVADLVAAGHDEAVVTRLARLVDLAEYKRRQFPPGPRVTRKAFGKDRRLPITNAYRG